MRDPALFCMNDIRLFIFDIDGTTFDHSIYAIREKTMEALKALKEKGYYLCVSTSRSKDEMKDLPAAFLNLMDGIVSSAGTCVQIGCYRKITAFSEGEILPVLTYMDEHDEITYRYVTNEGRSFINRHEQWVEDIYRRLYHMCPELKPYDHDRIIHINYYLNGHDEFHKGNIEKLIPQAIHTYLRVTTEITPEGVDKAHILSEIADHFHIDVKNICSFGDGDNDATMMKRSGFSVAMGNATGTCKEAADYICEDIMEEGLYRTLVKFGFIETLEK